MKPKHYQIRRWQEKEFKTEGNTRYFSLSSKLKRENKTTEQFEVMFNNLTLEELIGLKLELASKCIGGKLYGLPIWNSLLDILKDAVFKYVFSCARTKKDAQKFLGIGYKTFEYLLSIYDTENYFNPSKRKDLDKLAEIKYNENNNTIKEKLK